MVGIITCFRAWRSLRSLKCGFERTPEMIWECACLSQVCDRGTDQLAGVAHAQVCAPRFSVLQQTWREDDDGTYIVLLQSTDSPAMRSLPPIPGFWLHPVPVTVRPCPRTSWVQLGR